MEQLPSEVSFELNMLKKRIRSAEETCFDLVEGGKIVGTFLGALFTVSDPTKNFKEKSEN